MNASLKKARPGALLVAGPGLNDPNFRRSIILLASHDETGSLGFILNRPANQDLGDVVAEGPSEIFSHVPVFHGGPVAVNQIILAGLRWSTEDNQSIEVVQTFSHEGDEWKMIDSELVLRAFQGYAGWNGGQLEQELAQDSWLVVEPIQEVLQETPNEQTWKKILRSLGPRYSILAEFGDNPGLN